MAKKRKTTAKPKVSLSPFTWETEVDIPGGERAPLARPALEQADVDLDCAQGADGAVITRRARVWRRAVPPVMNNLNPTARAAMLDYAEALEAVGAMVGTSDPSGGGGGGGRQCSPNLRSIIAAERLRHMNQALAGVAMEVPVKNARRLRRGDGMIRTPLRQIAEWVAVDHLCISDIVTRVGASASNELARDGALLAIIEAGARLAICCGYVQGPTENAQHAGG